MRVLLIVVVAVAVAACRPSRPAVPFTLRVAVVGPLEPVTPDPEPRSWASIAIRIVFQPLLTVGFRGEIVPVLASRAEIAGQHTLRVWLRPDARFSDGSAVTRDDVLQSVSAAGLQASADGDTFVISSEGQAEPTELLLDRAYIFRRAKTGFLGTGPFAVESQDATSITLSRVVPAPRRIGRVQLTSYATSQEAFARTLKGDADMLPEVQPRLVEFFEGVPRLRILRGPGPTTNMVAFNRTRLSRVERVALASIVSSDEVRTLAFSDDCAPPEHRPEIEPLPRGAALDILTVPFFDRFAAAVRRSLGPRGGLVSTVQLQEFIAEVEAGQFDLATVRPRVWPPITAALIWRTGAASNQLGYSNPKVDAALDARDWAAAQRALEEDPPGAVVCTPPAIVVLDSRIHNAELTSNFIATLPQWEVEQ